MTRRKSNIREHIAMALLLLFVAYYGDAALFYHTHIINGVTIVHSHAHSSHHHDSSDGAHSASQITLISTLNSQLQATEAQVSGGLEAFFHLIRIIGQARAADIVKVNLQYQSDRAPPFFG